MVLNSIRRRNRIVSSKGQHSENQQDRCPTFFRFCENSLDNECRSTGRLHRTQNGLCFSHNKLRMAILSSPPNSVQINYRGGGSGCWGRHLYMESERIYGSKGQHSENQKDRYPSFFRFCRNSLDDGCRSTGRLHRTQNGLCFSRNKLRMAILSSPPDSVQINYRGGGVRLLGKAPCIWKVKEYMALKANIQKISRTDIRAFFAFAEILSTMDADQLGDFRELKIGFVSRITSSVRRF